MYHNRRPIYCTPLEDIIIRENQGKSFSPTDKTHDPQNLRLHDCVSKTALIKKGKGKKSC